MLQLLCMHDRTLIRSLHYADEWHARSMLDLNLIFILYYSVLQAFLEQGIPTTPQMLVAMMPKVSCRHN